jgi:predicted RNase H-like HicB family nuclease
MKWPRARPYHREASRIEQGAAMTKYNIVIEDAGSNYSAYVAGLNGVISTGTTVEEVTEKMREAHESYLEGMR